MFIPAFNTNGFGFPIVNLHRLSVMFPDSHLMVYKFLIGFITPSFLASACLGIFGHPLSTLLNYFVWLRITDKGSVVQMRIWTILLIKSDLK